MKTSKRIWLGLSAFLFVFTMILSVFPAEKTLAAGPASSKQDVINCGNSLKFVSIAELTCTFGGTTAHFIDQNPSDSGLSSNSYYNVNYAPDSSFCDPGALNGQAGQYHSGVSRRGSTNAFKLSDAGKPIDIKLNVGYMNAKTQCVRIDSSNQDYTIPGARTAGIRTLLQFGSQTLDSLDSVNDGGLSGKSYGLVGGFTYSKNTVVYTDGFTPGSCSGEVVTVDTSNKSAVRYNLNGDGANNDITKYPGLTAFLKAQSTAGCYVHEGDTNFGLGSGSFDVSGTPPTSSEIAQAPAAGSTQGGQSINSSSDCAANSGGFSLSWLMCPVAQAAVSLTDEFIGLFEDQLSFRVSDLNPTSPGADNGYNETKASWAIIRDVASSLIVIFMLVMVLSQAISWGPFDAYTVKKLLPKLVIAIVVMQISWDLFVWVVGLFDDLGHGIADIMYLPFHGPSNMDFWHLLSNAHISAWTMGALDWAALAAGLLAISMAFLPAFLGLLTGALMALAFGLFTLVFRKILIIMLLMLSPLALVAWILPGTASYWKMWRENFIKALSMFPIAMGLIAAGRIFAKVAGSQNGNGTFLNMIFVFVGFFGPLFILPKTFKWGGQAMQMAGNGIMKARDKANSYPQKYFKARQENWNSRNKARSYERVRNGEGWKWNKPLSYVTTPLDRFGSGEWDPLLGAKKSWGVDTPFKGKDGKKRRLGFKGDSSMRRSTIQQYKEKGHKVDEEEQNLADREANDDERRLDQQGFDEGGYNHDHLWQDKLSGHMTNYEKEYFRRDYDKWKEDHPGGSEDDFRKSDDYGYKDYTGNVITVEHPHDKYELNAARNMLAKFGGPNHPVLLSHLWQEKFSKDNNRVKDVMEWAQGHSDFILKVYPQFLKGVSSTAGNSNLTGMHPIGFRDELGRLSAKGDVTATRRFVSNLIGNMSSPTRDGIETDIRTLVRAIAGGDKEYYDGINEQIVKDMAYETGIIDKDSGENHPPAIDVDFVLRALRGTAPGEEDLTAKINAMIAPDRTGAYTSAATGSGGAPAPTPTPAPATPDTPDTPEPDEPPTPDRSYSGHPDTPRPADARGPVPPVDPRPGYETTAPPDEGYLGAGGHTRFSSDRGYASASAAPAARPAAVAAPAEKATSSGPSYMSESFSSFEPSVASQSAATTPQVTREVRTVQGNTSTRPMVINQTGAQGQPIVQVNVDHQAIGDAVAQGMRNALLHTTLKIEHPDGGSGSAGFAPKKEGEESPWDGLRPPGPSEPPTGGAAPHE